jgi:hypothetical protein
VSAADLDAALGSVGLGDGDSVGVLGGSVTSPGSAGRAGGV